MDSSLTPNPEDFELSLTPNPEHSERISRSMRVLSYEEAKEGVSRYIEEPLQEKGALTSWDLSFAEYIEEHKDSSWYFAGTTEALELFSVRPIIMSSGRRNAKAP